ncbi:hypothetical protein Asppvi_007038 [Aspergillus pseudoviridinutans]|uniref:Cytochrome P450 n=1 Tax=Aspergillus pseudoviridinutans TaxID=1517512 RepID=A0A9P3EU27_9EURO|nr:uncharacterized protein Asppvi_007038 [Aspergillus pseudoviridinutans]GIJ88121.1 hypothetical protein Asppvi_007038 [Aspergillus pseudoviridinutans]
MSSRPPNEFFLVGAGMVIIIGYAIYQNYLHPLAKYPGPFLGKFLKMEAVHRILSRSSGDVHLHIRRCHLKYGEMSSLHGVPQGNEADLRVLQDRLYATVQTFSSSIPSQDLKVRTWLRFNLHRFLTVPDIYVNSKNIVKDDCYQLLHIGAKSILTATDPKDHGRRARIIRPGFANSSIKEFEPKIRTHALRLLDALSSASTSQEDHSWGQPLSMSDWCSYSTLDIITDLVFGRSSDLVRRPELRHIVSDIEGMLEHASFLMHAPYVLFGRLDNEIRRTFQSLDEIKTGASLQSCTYLEACLKETLRISPGVAGALYRKVGKGGAVIDGHLIPEGCSVATGIYSLHHNESYFSQPDVFIPERWLSDSETPFPFALSAAYTPFSLGSRACLGRNLALTELQILTAAIVWQFDFRFPPRCETNVGAGHPLGSSGRANPVEFQLSDYIVSHKKGPVLQLRPRRQS